MKYFVIFLYVMFSGCLLHCMKFPENRQLMVDINASLEILKKEAATDNTSRIAIEIYKDCVRRYISNHINNKEACAKLVALGLCRIEKGLLIPIEYFIDDRLPKLEQITHLPRRF